MRMLRAAFLPIALLFATGAYATTVWGPKTFANSSGRPQTVIERFSITPADVCGGRADFTLFIQNGDGSGKRVSSATIDLNGKRIADESDFDERVSTLEIPIRLQAQNELAVLVKGGGQGASMAISVRKSVGDLAAPPMTFALTQKKQTFTATFPVFEANQAYGVGFENGAKSVSIRLNGVPILSEKEIKDAAKIARILALLSGKTITFELAGEVGDSFTVTFKRIVDESVCVPQIAFITPAEGAMQSAPRITVTGTVTGTRDVGMTVNGMPALIDLTTTGTAADPFRWFCQLDVAPGALQLQSTATDSTGAQSVAARSITVIAADEYVALRPSATSGIAPLAVQFNLDVHTRAAPAQIQLDLDGDGVFEIQSTTLPAISPQTYAAGSRMVTAAVITAGGRRLTSSVPIVVQPFAVADVVLRTVWNGFLKAFTSRDVDGALAMLTADARVRYRDRLTLITSDLPSIAASIDAFRTQSIDARTAQYLAVRVQNGRRFGYHIQFARDEKNVWRLTQF